MLSRCYMFLCHWKWNWNFFEFFSLLLSFTGLVEVGGNHTINTQPKKNWAKQKVDNLFSHRLTHTESEWVCFFNNYACTSGDKNACESIFFYWRKRCIQNVRFETQLLRMFSFGLTLSWFTLLIIEMSGERWDDTHREKAWLLPHTDNRTMMTNDNNCSYYAKKSVFSQTECGREWDTLGLETLSRISYTYHVYV